MATKQERLFEHAEKLGQVIPSGDPQAPIRSTWGDVWKAQAEYLDQHFVERALVEHLRKALEKIRDVEPNSADYVNYWQMRGIAEAALEATKEE